MLQKRRKIVKRVVFLRKTRTIKGNFCCYNENICQFYDNKKNSLKCLAGIKALGLYTDIYHLCSYLNYIESKYIYAPEKTI